MDQDPKPSTSRGFALGQSTDTDASNEPGRSTFTGAEFSSSTEGGRSNSSDLGSSSSSSPIKQVPGDLKKYKVDKQYLRSRLSAVAYEVTQEKGTELPFSGDLVHTDSAGVYYCLICDAELFSSKTKYDASCGWPSFYDAIDQSRVILTPDHTASRTRTEVSCARCDAHLGHFFQKETTPTGNRYCINSCALVFRKSDDCVQPLVILVHKDHVFPINPQEYDDDKFRKDFARFFTPDLMPLHYAIPEGKYYRNAKWKSLEKYLEINRGRRVEMFSKKATVSNIRGRHLFFHKLQ